MGLKRETFPGGVMRWSKSKLLAGYWFDLTLCLLLWLVINIQGQKR